MMNMKDDDTVHDFDDNNDDQSPSTTSTNESTSVDPPSVDAPAVDAIKKTVSFSQQLLPNSKEPMEDGDGDSSRISIGFGNNGTNSGSSGSSSGSNIITTHNTSGSSFSPRIKKASLAVAKSVTAVAGHTQRVLKHTERVVETNAWCIPLQFVLHFPHDWPRTSAFVFGVLVPLWTLIFISMGFGILLAQYESDTEIVGNDAILAARAHLATYDLSAAQLLSVTAFCLAEWEQLTTTTTNTSNTTTTSTVASNETKVDTTPLETTFDTTLDTLDAPNATAIISESNEDFFNTMDTNGDGLVYINYTLLKQETEECTKSFLPALEDLQQVQVNFSDAFEGLSFNWIRCWNTSGFGDAVVFHPTHEMIVAARPDAQEQYFTAVWTRMQQELYLHYLSATPNPTEQEQRDAFERSVAEATGDEACKENLGGTAWFFFTIMTTMGYGNQSPGTTEGRMLIVTAGLFSIILFGAVLGLSGYVLLAIFDDFVGRFCFSRFLGNPFFGVLMWGTIWFFYALAIATDVEYWWEERLPEYAAGITRTDSLWFAFISTSTIGLGDYYLQPEVIFISDTLKYSAQFIIGFVFLSTFFGKIAESLARILPQKQNSLEARLAATRVLACWPRGWLPWETAPPPMGNPAEMPVDELPVDDQALIYRMEKLRELKPDPPTPDDGEEEYRGVSTVYNGNPIHSMNVELLGQEESILREWLAVIEHQKERALLKQQLFPQEHSPQEPELCTFRELLVELATIPELTSSDKRTSPSNGVPGTSTHSGMSTIRSGSDEDKDKKTQPNYQGNTADEPSGGTRSDATPVEAPSPSRLLHDSMDEDHRMVITAAEETFNPLASFFNRV